MLGSVEDNLDEFKLNVHNIFTVRFSRPVEFCPLLYNEFSKSFLIGRKRTVNFRNQRP